MHLKANRLSWQDQQVGSERGGSSHSVGKEQRKEEINVFDHHEAPPVQAKVDKKMSQGDHFEGMNLLDSGHSKK